MRLGRDCSRLGDRHLEVTRGKLKRKRDSWSRRLFEPPDCTFHAAVVGLPLSTGYVAPLSELRAEGGNGARNSPGVRVDLRAEHQEVDVQPLGQAKPMS